MKINQIVKSLMTLRGYTFRSLANKMGKSSSSTVANMLARENGMRLDKLMEILNIMDCELVVRSKLSDKSEWVVVKELTK